MDSLHLDAHCGAVGKYISAAVEGGVVAATDELLNGSSSAQDDESLPSRRWLAPTSTRSVWLNAGALLVVLLALIAFVDNGQVAVPDEGVYLAQAENLSNGSWSRERPALDVDENGLFAQVTDNGVAGDRVIAYYKHPLYPLVLTPAFGVAGTTGTLALSVLGTWGAAVAAAFIARRVDRRYGLWALWLVGVGSPLIFDAYITVAHSIAAAFAGLALLGLSRALDDRRATHLLYALPAIGMVVALRGEGIILAGVTGGVIGVTAVGWPPFRSMNWRNAWIGAAVLVSAVVVAVIDRLAAAAIIGGSGSDPNPLARLSAESLGPLGGAWASLVRPFAGSWVNAGILLPIAASAVILAALCLKVAPRFRLLPVLLSTCAGLAAFGLLWSPPGLVTGLFAAFPILAAGLISLGIDDLRTPLSRRLVAISALTAVVIVATNYSVGGASEWGGRFYHLLLPLLVPVAICGLDRARQRLPRSEQLAIGVALASVVLCTSASAMWALRAARNATSDRVEATIDYARVQDQDLIVLSKLYPDGAARGFWATSDPELLTSYGLSTLHIVLTEAQRAGRDSVLIATDINPVLFGEVLADTLAELDWEVRESSISPGKTTALVVVGEATS